ncbi:MULTISPECIES: non-hydrolyzing UDP-N-acetylglucosamine 2-epimerase [Megasphaera]|jgi:UDP-N-acetylglucosamine 2-epimerase (non-hydrolysing)|uniref:UDP-N-acetylglucosamine 2-epimerase (non-hydrolyzing) n=2 Tax=Megasphaera TaxID=906 RepID=A0ABV1CVE5_9FIRM|nr:UDP-N-acetylglucosamine 2-epimerase (non-hydrolyzing) [Megasphaera sp.]MCH3903182.1 UDP-N-acetylglucosamine 2-epimerase (non-hydrolyzing) [Limosilactobacillus oris]MCI1888085.1 UDP-N-acetylglucosamine 2-epimerase (non-hydrolyzing) [Sporolactobacillus sp.]MCI1906031.1 UDP-N-acetylglucosamine 2-epimerase (non-hydrolyzing) [Enterococcaceae bacterium]MBS7222193.1 UDP-N-acetylglucosamine 2-epimerase (non-hydrolyzing) [Megasphaera sp.]MCH3931754.1 UDP-N-acetylglucosamine 2-epimerase (non-hydrolyz
MIKVMTVFGTRPEAIKMAPVVLELQKHADRIQTIVAVTAQHRQMLDQVLDLFQITPDYDLDIMSQGQTLYDITTKSLMGLKDVLAKEKPDLVLVHGDTTTTFAGALASYYQQVPVGHVEAGLRTGDIYSPFPEEMNRKLTGAIAAIHFAPTATAKANLLKENVNPSHIYVTGNTVIDALMMTVAGDYDFGDDLKDVDFHNHRVILLTTHRRENLGEPMRHIYKALRRIIEEIPDTEIVFPVHRNPLVRKVVEEELAGVDRIHLIDPMEYEPFANLMSLSSLVLTDSGGIQEEAPSLGKPVLVLRNTTERPEAVEAGTVRLIGTDKDVVYAETKRLLTDQAAYDAMSNAVNPYGDGKASQRIVQAILHVFAGEEAVPDDFSR